MAAANSNSKKANSNSSPDGSDLDPLWQNLDWYVLAFPCYADALIP